MLMRFIVALLLLFLLAACGGPETPPTATPAANDETALPTTTAGEQDPQAYPAAGSQAYPAAGYPAPDIGVNDIPFVINEPVAAGETQVSGSGPSLVPIRLVDITADGQVLAERVIPGDGQFTLELVEPLLADHEIGLLLGNPGTPDVPPFLPDYYNQTEGAEEVPGIGIILDSATVQP